MNLQKNFKAYVFYDSDCMMCSRFTSFVGRAKGLHCASNKELKLKIKNQTIDSTPIKDKSIIVISDNQILTKAEAILFILSHIKYLKIVSFTLSLLPLFFLNLAYDFISKHRLLFFSKSTVCNIRS